jgi:hypothetical protein
MGRDITHTIQISRNGLTVLGLTDGLNLNTLPWRYLKCHDQKADASMTFEILYLSNTVIFAP